MLTQTATYAIRAMAYIASRKSEIPVLSQIIAGEMHIPRNFLSKILHRLVQEGLILSVRGTKGGFVLTRKAKEIKLREVVAPFMNLAGYKQCFLGLHKCRNKDSCKVHKRWIPVVKGFEKLLGETTIDQVL